MTAERSERGSPADEGKQEQSTGVEADGRETEASEAGEGAEAAGGDDAAAELESTRDRYMRLAAEYDNYRKRTERERTESWSRAQAQLVERLLDALDDLQRVAEHAGESTSREALLEGVQLVERKLFRALEAAGLEIVDPAGEDFNPERHEALMRVAADAPDDDDTVAQVFQKGYEFKGILLRPARVQVRKYEG